MSDATPTPAPASHAGHDDQSQTPITHADQAQATPAPQAEAEQKDGNQDQGKDNKKKDKKPLYKRPVLMLVLVIVVILLLCGGIYWWLQSRSHVSTDDAFIDGRGSQIAAQVSGRVVKLLVDDNEIVHAGQPLLEIDARDYQVKLDQALGQLANAEAQLTQARAQTQVAAANAGQADAQVHEAEVEAGNSARDRARYEGVDQDAISQQQVDQAQTQDRSNSAKVAAAKAQAGAAHRQIDSAYAQVKTAQAAVVSARAQVKAAELQLSYTHVVAPVDGRITKRSVESGNYVNPGQALLAIVGQQLWVTANFKETQLTDMRPGQPVEIKVDTYPGVKFNGKVASIQAGTGSYFSQLPAENATGNYVKVVQRLPVKIWLDDDRIHQYLLVPGMSVVPTVTVK